eukprot:3908134-Amphidinium_carterae.1
MTSLLSASEMTTTSVSSSLLTSPMTSILSASPMTSSSMSSPLVVSAMTTSTVSPSKIPSVMSTIAVTSSPQVGLAGSDVALQHFQHPCSTVLTVAAVPIGFPPTHLRTQN